MANGTKLIDTSLSGGGTVIIRAVDLGGPQDVGIADKLPFDEVTDSIRKVGASIVAALQDVAPKKATVEFGLEVAVKGGHLVSLLTDAGGKATFTVTLEWGE
jgi:Trypsin-co-occurring domain 1